MTFRLAVIADIHHGPDTRTKCGEAALGLARDAVAAINASGADAVLDLGDRISDTDPDSDALRAAEVAEALSDLAMPRHHLDGNHDLDHLTRDENDRILGRAPGHSVVQAGEWDLVLWQPDPRLIRDGVRGLRLDDADFDWLSGTVRHAERPLVIASHTPVSPASMTGNYYFEDRPDLAVFPQAPQVRALLGEARVPVICLSGHVHWNTVAQENGIAYLTQQSLSESSTTGGHPAGAWGMLELGDDVTWRVMGRDPLCVTLTPGAGRWLAPHARPARKIASVPS